MSLSCAVNVVLRRLYGLGRDTRDKGDKSDLEISEFAHYTGRSLSSFKKDFEGTFRVSPGRWLTKRRLQEAHRMMENGEKPLDVYLQVGFKNLSHFSTAFKREYGIPPSALAV